MFAHIAPGSFSVDQHKKPDRVTFSVNCPDETQVRLWVDHDQKRACIFTLGELRAWTLSRLMNGDQQPLQRVAV